MEEQKVMPGNLHHGKFPPPTEIVCIWVKKIYDACSQKECDEFFFDDLNIPTDVPLQNLEVTCHVKPNSETFRDWSITPLDGGPLGLVKVTVCAELELRVYDVNNPSNFAITQEEVCFIKEVILYAPDPVKMQVLVESIFECLAATGEIVNGNFVVTAIVGAFIIVKTGLKVQLLVPAYGFCPVPPECEELGDLCEQFLQRPFPPFFPPQIDDFPNNG